MEQLQRYRINNSGQIADDNGGYCDADDVTELEATNKELVKALEDIERDLLEVDPQCGKLYLFERCVKGFDIASKALKSDRGES